MRFYTEHTEHYIQLLAAAVSKDPASLDGWRCVHLDAEHPEQANLQKLFAFKEQQADCDCDVILCSDNDILLISRELSNAELLSMGDTIASLMPQAAFSLTCHDLYREWRNVYTLLLTKAGTSSPCQSALESADFQDAHSFDEVFTETRLLRQARSPQYVMIVEDDPLTRRIIAGAFKGEYAIVSATTAQEAVENYLLYAPDIVFLDIGLPDVSGFTVLREILNCDPDAYVVMFSGNSYLDNVTKALNAGASGFVAKPFRHEKLRHYIEDSALHHQKLA